VARIELFQASFDTVDRISHNRFVRRSFRCLVTAFVLVGLSVTTWATCAEGAMSPEARQMACCKNGHHTCGKDGAPADCCKKEGSKANEVVTIAKLDPGRTPAPVAMVWAVLTDVAVLDCGHRALVHATSPPIPSLSPPPYIAFSSLLI